MPHDFTSHDLAAIEAITQEVGRHLFGHLPRRQPNILQRRWWDDRIMSWAMQDESVKVQMFRFIDVLPMLKDSAAITRHLREYFQEVSEHLPSAVRLGLAVARPESITGRALAIAARRNAMSHARRFIAGTTSKEVLATALKARKSRMAFTLDLLGEAVITESEADHYLHSCEQLVCDLSAVANTWQEVPQIDRGVLQELPRVNVSIKLSALDAHFDPLDREGTTQRVAERLRRLLRLARGHRAFINVDMESYQVKDLTLHIFQNVLMEDEFRQVSDVGIVIQGYLKDSLRDLMALRDWAKHRGKPVWLRLVKGAYWDYETVRARYLGWPVPVYERKWETDANYEASTRFLFRNHAVLHPALGSHNLRSLAHGIAVARFIGLPLSGFELQMLYGMADAEKETLVEMGHRLRIYMPYGELIPGMAYLVRRLLENTSNESFLRASFTDQVSPEKLMENPLDTGTHDGARREPTKGEKTVSTTSTTTTATTTLTSAPRPKFRNEPPADFSQESQRRAMAAALKQVAGELGCYCPIVIGGESVDTSERLTSLNPSHFAQVVGTTAAADAALAKSAVLAAEAAFPDWAALEVRERADFLRRAAQVMRERRTELAAWAIYECGKNWREADGDICEAIDFCEYYAAGAELLQGQPIDMGVPGEENQYWYAPRGVAAVIAPWNFPLAILAGMTVAALATGNTVVMKPAEQSPIIAARLMEILAAVGLPPGVLNYLPGRGEVAGAALVEDPRVTTIAFTGSRAVGLAIHRSAAAASASGAAEVKRVIAEMGGKNAIIVDADADLDEAVLGVIKSAFGYQGQKCSACSRCIVLAPICDAFLQRLVGAVKSLQVGPAEDPGAHVGPVIDQEAFDRIRRYIEIGKQEARLALGIDVGKWAHEGYYVGPHIFADVPHGARIAQEEIFGPVLAVIRAQNLDEAIQIANGTDYALTGGVYSRSPANLRRVRTALCVGNLYLNREITGAMVARQPFGGFRMSGIGSKAGGPDYLLQFVVPRTVTENTLRRGFAPKEEENS